MRARFWKITGPICFVCGSLNHLLSEAHAILFATTTGRLPRIIKLPWLNGEGSQVQPVKSVDNPEAGTLVAPGAESPLP
jgi:hypothetical protein